MLRIFGPLIIAAYFLGSVPFGLLIAKAKGKDLRAVGSGNIGATNVARALGRKWGYICFALDVLKGLIPMTAGQILSTQAGYDQTAIYYILWLGVGCAAILGHIFPVYIKFQGGKGVATSFGVAVGLWPYFTICGLLAIGVWVTVLKIWRYISLASVTAAISFNIFLILLIIIIDSWRIERLWPLTIAATVIAILVLIRHSENIKRLKAGTEPKISERKS